MDYVRKRKCYPVTAIPGIVLGISVVDPKIFFLSDPDQSLGLILDPDPACLTKVIRLYKIKL